MKKAGNMTNLEKYFPYRKEQVNYLINCSKKHKFVYVETPKVACSTIKRVLQLIEVDGDESKLSTQVHDRGKSPLASPLSVDQDLDELFEGDGYFRFSFVRNPYSRILSAYLDKLVKNDWERRRLLPTLGYNENDRITLLQFLEAIKDIPNIDKDIHWTPQSYILQRHKVNYDFIGRFENFSAGFERVIRKIKPDAGKQLFHARADHHKTDANSKLLKYIGPKEAELILEIYGSDFEVFRYSCDPHFGAV